MNLRILATLAVKGAMPTLLARFPDPVDADFAPTQALIGRIRGGEAADVALLTQEAVAELCADGVGAAAVDMADSFIGLAVRAGAPHPSIATVEQFVAALRAAGSIAYSRIGASGLYFAALIERLGIAEMVNAKATITPGGFTAERVARGEVELAVQQVSELLVVPGIELVGRLPDAIGTRATFSGCVFTASPRQAEAKSLLDFLTSEQAAPILRDSGLDPIPARRA